MTPAAKLRQAITLAQDAANEMHRIGVDKTALADIDQNVSDFKRAYDELASEIFEAEASHCPDCFLAERDTQRLAVGDGYYTRDAGYECTAKSAYQCPRVQACGFTDPSDPLAEVPAFLRKWAE